MNRLDPVKLFERIAADIPKPLRKHLFVAGSLAAAYHYRGKLQGHAVNTKDADLVVHPAGHAVSCQQMAGQLLNIGWERHKECYSQLAAAPNDDLRAIRLYPPDSHDYFVEFLNIPDENQAAAKKWVPVNLEDGWYGLPSFKFLGVTAIGRLSSHVGLEYARPEMMALANVLSHPQVGMERIESGPMTGVLRSAKDLGRVIALAWLEGRDDAEAWVDPWLQAVQTCFPEEWRELIRDLGSGLEDLLKDPNALEDAHKTTEIGLLNGKGVSVDKLRASGERLLEDVVLPLRRAAPGANAG